MNFKTDSMLTRPSIIPTDIIPLVNIAWSKSFAREESNKHAIAKRGWFPFNRNILLNVEVRGTMTKGDHEREENNNSIIIPQHSKDNFISIEDGDPTYDPIYLKAPNFIDSDYNTPEKEINVKHGFASHCLQNIVMHDDMMLAREVIIQRRDDGMSVANKMENMKRVTSGNIFKAGIVRLGEPVRDRVMHNQTELIAKEYKTYKKQSLLTMFSKKMQMPYYIVYQLI